MAITVNDSLISASPKPLDGKYGIFSGGTFRPYASVAEVNSTISTASRSVGLTVLVNTGSGNVEYWYQAGTADGNLIAKQPVVSTTSPLTFSAGAVGILQSNTSQSGFLSNSDWNAFNGKLGSVISAGSGAVPIYAGTSLGVASVKSLAAGTAVTLSDVSGTVTINATAYAGANLGSGSQLYTANSGANLQFRSLTAGAGVSLTQNTNDVNIAIQGQAVPTPASTSSASPTIIATQVIADNSAGILLVTMVGVVVGSTTSCTMAQRFVRYYKASGVLTILDGIFDMIPEFSNTFTSTAWTILVNGSNNFDVQVTGQASTNIKWAATLQNYTNS